MDTPKFPPPRNEAELQVLQELELIQSQLQIRRADRANYVRSRDVITLYDQTIEQVRRLTEVRQGRKSEENRGMLHYLHRSCSASLIPFKSTE